MVAERSRVLVGVLYCGEDQFTDCIASLTAQEGCWLEYFVIKNKPNAEAHNELYQAFMARSEEFDYFLKLDADMVFSRTNALASMLAVVEDDSSIDVLSLTVHDFFTNDPIWGVNLFSRRVYWRPIREALFVDEAPNYPGRSVRLTDWPQARVLHAHNPSLYQSFLFGVHRAMKVVQRDRVVPLVGHAYGQWRTLRIVTRRYDETNDERLLAALVGSYMVLMGKIPHARCHIKSGFIEFFDRREDWHDAAVRFWKHDAKWVTFLGLLGWLRVMGGAVTYVKRKLLG